MRAKGFTGFISVPSVTDVIVLKCVTTLDLLELMAWRRFVIFREIRKLADAMKLKVRLVLVDFIAYRNSILLKCFMG